MAADLAHVDRELADRLAGVEQIEEVVARGYNQNLGFAEAERASFGFDHAELGAEVARQWQLGSALEIVIRHHHDATRLGEATDVAAAAIERRFGAGTVDAKIQAHIVVVER